MPREWAPEDTRQGWDLAKFIIDGGMPLRGTIDVEANKNSVLPMMAACLLTDDDCYIDNVPGIVDVTTMTHILQSLGAEVERLDCHRLKINCSSVNSYHPPEDLVERLRASIVLLGPLLARFSRADMRHPGGDAIGTRSIASHLRVLQALGAEFERNDNDYEGATRQSSATPTSFLTKHP